MSAYVGVEHRWSAPLGSSRCYPCLPWYMSLRIHQQVRTSDVMAGIILIDDFYYLSVLLLRIVLCMLSVLSQLRWEKTSVMGAMQLLYLRTPCQTNLLSDPCRHCSQTSLPNVASSCRSLKIGTRALGNVGTLWRPKQPLTRRILCTFYPPQYQQSAKDMQGEDFEGSNYGPSSLFLPPERDITNGLAWRVSYPEPAATCISTIDHGGRRQHSAVRRA